MGAIPEPVDAIALKGAFLSHQIGGWFDQESQTLFMAEHGSDRENALALAYGYLFKHYGKASSPQRPSPSAWINASPGNPCWQEMPP